MAVFNEPSQWDHTLGNNADVSTLPDDTSATTGVASFQKLFQIINQTPLEAGGVAPSREDFNALFKVLGDSVFYGMNGGLASYNADYDYTVGRVVLYTDNNIYKCIQANGPSSTVVAPDSDDTYWQQLDKPTSALLPNQIITSPVPLTDANLHLLDGALLSGSGAYADYVSMMSALYTADPTANCWTDEATWQASVSSYGECGKFVYDSVNNTIRLPKLTSFVQATSTASELGNLVEAGVPNITGSIDASNSSVAVEAFGETPESNTVTLGALSGIYKEQSTTSDGGGSISMLCGFTLDASKSNSIYGNSTTVQPQAIKYYCYIVLGTVSKTEIQIDIDNVMSDLALKADTDLSNTNPNQAFKNSSIEWGQPDYTSAIAITLTLGTAVSYIAPDDGFIIYTLTSMPYQDASIVVNNHNVIYFRTPSSSEATTSSGIVPVHKGDSISITATGASSGYLVRHHDYAEFVPCKGV